MCGVSSFVEREIFTVTVGAEFLVHLSLFDHDYTMRRGCASAGGGRWENDKDGLTVD